jgi:hypothetical protein
MLRLACDQCKVFPPEAIRALVIWLKINRGVSRNLNGGGFDRIEFDYTQLKAKNLYRKISLWLF